MGLVVTIRKQQATRFQVGLALGHELPVPNQKSGPLTRNHSGIILNNMCLLDLRVVKRRNLSGELTSSIKGEARLECDTFRGHSKVCALPRMVCVTPKLYPLKLRFAYKHK